jgi:uncharacterized YigZ family protein
MRQVSETFSTTYEVKRSGFTSYLLPYPLFEATLEKLKSEHPKANHIVWAYRHLNSYDQVVENSTDDGEPKGCAGNPTLAKLRGEDLINTALITIRYFGGIKLGTGGMIRAYSDAAAKVIAFATLEPYVKKSPITFSTPYAEVKRYEHFFKTLAIETYERSFEADHVIWHLKLSSQEHERLTAFQKSLL